VDLLVLRSFPGIITVAEALRQELIAAGLPGDKIATVHNAIDAKAFTSNAFSKGPRLRQQMGIGAQQPVVSTVGRLSLQKGLPDFLESAHRVLSASPNARFLIIGDGPARLQLRDVSHRLGIQGAVSFLGHQRDIAPFMAMSDVIVMASLWEGLPYVLLEALALARPVVATRVGGVPEIVEDGSSGLLVPPRDPERLAAAILHLLRNAETAARLGQKGRERVEREFNVQTMARQTAQVYREVLRLG
jgi:glycosyltransferase involved in cell wall biosynthesis